MLHEDDPFGEAKIYLPLASLRAVLPEGTSEQGVGMLTAGQRICCANPFGRCPRCGERPQGALASALRWAARLSINRTLPGTALQSVSLSGSIRSRQLPLRAQLLNRLT